MSEHVAVVGAGALGLTAAVTLADRGAEVTVYERESPGSGASGRAAGIVYDAFAEDRDAAIASRALERFRALDRAGDIDLTPCPYVWLAREGDDAAADAIREQVPRMRAHDRAVDLLDGPALRERFPGIALADVAVAAVARDAAVLDTQAYVDAIARRARAAGADLRTNARAALGVVGDEAVTVVADGATDRFDVALVAAGAHTGRLLADAGHPLAVKPYRVQALVTDPLAPVGDGDVDEGDTWPVPACWDATGGYYFRPHGGGLLVGDGTEEREFDPDDYDETADDSFVRASRERVGAALGIDPDEVGVRRSWAGLCTATPDRNPLLGPVDGAGWLFAATGFHGHGFMRAPALGETVAEQLLGGEGIPAFDPRRFDGDEEFRVVEGMTVDESG